MNVSPVSADLLIKVGALALVGVGVYMALKKIGSAGSDLLTYGSDAVAGAVSAADDAVANVIVGAGGLVGIPATNLDQCELDLARGDTWAASFSCPASRFIKGQVNPPKNVGVSGTW